MRTIHPNLSILYQESYRFNIAFINPYREGPDKKPPMTQENHTIDLLDVSECTYKERLTANCLQGLANREGPRLFLDYGNYDDPGTRKTNSVQMTEENWFGKYRDFLNRNDLDNLDYYQTEYELKGQQT